MAGQGHSPCYPLSTLKTAIVFVSCFVLWANGSKINAGRLLLPYTINVPTNYTLEVEDGGCYKWTSKRPEVATVTAIVSEENAALGCSSQAIVTTVSRSSQRQSTIVMATEVGSGVTLRCDVDVDAIKSIEIITTTREITLDSIPEVFSVHAKNDHNDTFTCLGGIEFEWQLHSIKGSGDQIEPGNNLR